MTNALEFQLISPPEANAKESFLASINAETSDTYDVKLFVENPAKKVVSEIYNDAWKSGFYYIKSVFPEKKEFKIRIITDAGSYQLCARLRKTGKTSFDEKCNPIKLNPAQNPDPDLKESKEKKSSSSKDKDSSKKENNNEENEESITPQINNIKNTTIENQPIKSSSEKEQLSNPIEEKPERIILNSKSQKSPELSESTPFNTKYQTKQIYILYAFLAICIFIIILLALKKL